MNLKRKELYWPLRAALASALALPAAAFAQTYTQVEAITYHDNTTIWKLGQVAERTLDGKVVSSRTYDPTYALPLTVSSFGKLRQTLDYDLTSSVASGQRGTITRSSDGNGNTTVISQWRRGIPQRIEFADGTSQSAEVGLRGWLESVTDENGFTTSYGYDGMGRIAAITHPTGDAVAWNRTTQVFEQVTAPSTASPPATGARRSPPATGARSSTSMRCGSRWSPASRTTRTRWRPCGSSASPTTTRAARPLRLTRARHRRSIPVSGPSYDALGRQVAARTANWPADDVDPYFTGFQPASPTRRVTRPPPITWPMTSPTRPGRS